MLDEVFHHSITVHLQQRGQLVRQVLDGVTQLWITLCKLVELTKDY
jgi:hypothetical protein